MSKKINTYPSQWLISILKEFPLLDLEVQTFIQIQLQVATIHKVTIKSQEFKFAWRPPRLRDMLASTSPMRIRSMQSRKTLPKRRWTKRLDRRSSQRKSSPLRKNQTSPRTRWLSRGCRVAITITAPMFHKDPVGQVPEQDLWSNKNLRIAHSQYKTWEAPWSIHCRLMAMSYQQISAIIQWTTVCLETSSDQVWLWTINWTVLDKGSLTLCFRHMLTLSATKIFWVTDQRQPCR